MRMPYRQTLEPEKAHPSPSGEEPHWDSELDGRRCRYAQWNLSAALRVPSREPARSTSDRCHGVCVGSVIMGCSIAFSTSSRPLVASLNCASSRAPLTALFVAVCYQYS